MTQNIPEVASNVLTITTAEFVKLRIFNDISNVANISTYTFSSSYKTETIDSVNYTPLGYLLQVGGQNRDLRVTSAGTQLALSGIDANNIALVLDTKIRGSEVTVSRGFYDANMVLQNTYLRFTGVVTSYAIAEDRTEQNDNFTVTIQASSYKTVLENRLAGRKTNRESWRYFDANDSSMDRVYSIAQTAFDFGKKPKGVYFGGGGGGYYGTNDGYYEYYNTRFGGGG